MVKIASIEKVSYSPITDMHVLLIWGPRGIYIEYRCSCNSGGPTALAFQRPNGQKNVGPLALSTGSPTSATLAGRRRAARCVLWEGLYENRTLVSYIITQI